MCTDAYTCIYTEGSSYMYILHVYKYIHTCIFIYACICIYIYVYIYTYMNTQWSPLGIYHRLVCYVLALNICSCVCVCMCVWYSALAFVCVCDIQHQRMCVSVRPCCVCSCVCRNGFICGINDYWFNTAFPCVMRVTSLCDRTHPCVTCVTSFTQ